MIMNRLVPLRRQRLSTAGRAGWVVMVAASAAVNVSAQGTPARSGALNVSSSIALSETLTDAHRQSDGSTRGESIITVTPAVRVSSRSARAVSSLDYSLAAHVYARDSSANQLEHRLSGALFAEVVEDHMTVDLRAQIARQPVSAFSLQTPGELASRHAQTHVKTFSVAPVLRARPGGRVDLSARMLWSATDTGSGAVSDSSSTSAAVRVSSLPGASRLAWSLDASRQVVDFKQGRRTEDDRIIAGLGFQVDPELRADLRAGVEKGNVASLVREQNSTWGGGLAWTPGERTHVSLSGDRRAFGHSHAFDFQHRMRRTLWRFSDRQDVTTGTNAGTALVPAYELFFALFASQEPDPILRAQLVDSFLLRNSIAPEALVNGGLLTSASALQRRRELSVAIQGLRTSAVLSGFDTQSRRAYALAFEADDLAAGELTQRGLAFTVSHRLTPTSTLGFSATTTRSSAIQGGARSRMDSLSANWTERLGRRTNVTLGLRHTASETASERYDENALLANLYMRF